MPKLDSHQVKHRMAELRLTSLELAEQTGIPWGSLRNALAGRDPITLDRVYAIARVLFERSERDAIQELVEQITAEDGVPENPPDQTKPKPKPERRKEKGGSGPKRDQNMRGVA